MQRKLFMTLLAALAVTLTPAAASADHAWGGLHWARTTSEFNLRLGDNLILGWDAALATASTDWSKSPVLNTSIVAGRTTPRNCRPTTGRVEVCNSKYGYTGWLGVAQVWASGTHITQGTVKMNDSYFNYAPYNTAAWKQTVLCQEIGHTLGLDHQDENFDNAPLGTCMDYSSNPVPNQHPNQHDYDELEGIYAHLDSTSTVGNTGFGLIQQAMGGEPSDWGKLIRRSGASAVYEHNFGGGQKLYTFVAFAAVAK